ncbi:hypothetical protein PoB_006710000 [Plakobranchus ocellatus]|uniref:Uncharacterized protein n=1 Tax=Plakobranchus ocellatus TaxID=259542 RepID=A0AAV4D952_9GAST|nr:hypothetical protein PoB_006710000 [Plakobranchus ocellatus]
MNFPKSHQVVRVGSHLEPDCVISGLRQARIPVASLNRRSLQISGRVCYLLSHKHDYGLLCHRFVIAVECGWFDVADTTTVVWAGQVPRSNKTGRLCMSARNLSEAKPRKWFVQTKDTILSGDIMSPD